MDRKLIKRQILTKILNLLDKNRIIIIIGPRQTGKTSLLYLIKKNLKKETVFSLNAEKASDQIHLIDFESFSTYLKNRGALGKRAVVFIDEFQKTSRPTKLLKLVYDELPLIKIIATGSSSLEIYGHLSKESLPGRKRIINLFPLTFGEFIDFRYPEEKIVWQNILKNGHLMAEPKIYSAWQDFVVWGGYPKAALIDSEEERREELNDIYNAYLEKDVAGLLSVDERPSLIKLTAVLASQSGNLLNINELANTLKLARSTIERYLRLLTETFIIAILPPFYTNKRKEITKMPKIYFLDNGLRNALRNDFSPLEIRSDAGALVENCVFTELIKNRQTSHSLFFWRTPLGAETDFIIRLDQFLFPVEVKYKALEKPIIPSGLKAFLNNYHSVKAAFVLSQNFTAQITYNNIPIYFLPAPFSSEIFPIIKTIS